MWMRFLTWDINENEKHTRGEASHFVIIANNVFYIFYMSSLAFDSFTFISKYVTNLKYSLHALLKMNFILLLSLLSSERDIKFFWPCSKRSRLLFIFIFISHIAMIFVIVLYMAEKNEKRKGSQQKKLKNQNVDTISRTAPKILKIFSIHCS